MTKLSEHKEHVITKNEHKEEKKEFVMTRLEAVEKLDTLGSNVIVSAEDVKLIGESFKYKPEPEEVDKLNATDLARKLCEHEHITITPQIREENRLKAYIKLLKDKINGHPATKK